MERGRILIIGGSRETTYEIRNLLDHNRFELEIALSPDVGKHVLTERMMSILILHSEILDERCAKLLQYLDEKDLEIPIMILGEHAAKFRGSLRSRSDVECFEKPYQLEELLNYIRAL